MIEGPQAANTSGICFAKHGQRVRIIIGRISMNDYLLQL